MTALVLARAAGLTVLTLVHYRTASPRSSAATRWTC